MQVAFSMVLALAMILFGAELFTNAVEWLGHELHLGQSAVGSVLAALGTALPETAVPVTAILFGKGTQQAQDIGIGGILGAPFLLATLGSLILAISLLLTRRTEASPKLAVERRGFQRDLTFFLISYAFVLLVGCTSWPWLHKIAPGCLVLVYIFFLYSTLRDKTLVEPPTMLQPLYLQWKAKKPFFFTVVLQLLCALAAIVGGAQLLASGVEVLAVKLLIPPFILSVILIPLTTELPETLNSVLWIRQGKDALALGNITGAMVFQSTLVPALGIWLTSWNLNPEALLTGGLTVAASALIFGMFRLHGSVIPEVLFAASLLYWILPIQAIAIRYQIMSLYWVGGLVIVFAVALAFRVGMRYRST